MLRGFAVVENVARFMSNEHQADWAAVKKVFLALGAKWRTGKPGGFVFPEAIDGVEVVRLAIESGEIVDPRKAGFFPTPDALADRIVAVAGIRPGDTVIEPSAGRGAIARAVLRACPSADLVCVELLPDNAAALRSAGLLVIEGDFLSLDPKRSLLRANVVVMNPPFSAGADIEHVRHAISFLVSTGGGRLVSVMSAGVVYRQNGRANVFRRMVAELGGRFEENPDGSFAESGTMVRTVTLVIPGGHGGAR